MNARSPAIAAVVLLHVAMIAALLNAVVRTTPEKIAPQTREVMLALTLPSMAKTSQAPVKGVERRGAAVFSAPTLSPFASPTAQGAALGAALFGCTPERMAALPREEREKCERQTGFTYTAFANLPMKFAPKIDRLSNSDIEARKRNTVDPCMAAKLTGTECIHEVIFGKGLP